MSKGAVAPHADLVKSFPDMDIEAIILDILKKGELQVGEKERGAQLEQIHNEVIQIVTGKCVDPGSGRPYTTGMIEKALSELMTKGGGSGGGGTTAGTSTPNNGETDGSHNNKGKEREPDEPRWTGVVTTKSAKSQALDAIRALVHFQPIPISRARMRLRIFLPSTVAKKLRVTVVELVEEVVDEDFGGDGWTAEVVCEPGKYRDIGDLIGKETKGKGRVEVLETAVVNGERDD